MALFNADSLKRFEYLSLLAQRAEHRALLSTRHGGTEVTGLRDYAPGDDYRQVDWRWCARRDELMSRTFGGRGDGSLDVLLDCSASMGLGNPTKFDLARRITAMLGYVAAGRSDRFSVTAFSGNIIDRSPPLRCRSGMARLLRFLDRLDLHDGETDLTRSAERFAAAYQPHGPVVVISDLYDPRGFEPGLDILRHRGYEPSVVQIFTADEADPGLLGDVELCDIEGRDTQRATITQRAAARYRQVFAEFHRSVRDYCGGHADRCLQLTNDMPEDEALLTVLGLKP